MKGITLSYKELIQVIADYYEADIFRVSIMGFSHGCYGLFPGTWNGHCSKLDSL